MNQTNETIVTLVRIAAYLNRSIPVLLLLFGTIGNLLNLYILSRRSLRRSSCLFYFFAASVANLFCLWCGLTTRLLSGYDMDPTTNNSFVCKLRYFITYMSLSLSAFFLLFASADRWASSNARMRVRSYCEIKFARRLVVITALIGCLLYSQVFYCYIAAAEKFPVFCYCPTLLCRIYNDSIFLLLYSIIPPIFMLIFSWLTVRNVKKMRQQVNVTTPHSHFRNDLMKKRDRQMITMLVMKVLSFSLCFVATCLC